MMSSLFQLPSLLNTSNALSSVLADHNYVSQQDKRNSDSEIFDSQHCDFIKMDGFGNCDADDAMLIGNSSDSVLTSSYRDATVNDCIVFPHKNQRESGDGDFLNSLGQLGFVLGTDDDSCTNAEMGDNLQEVNDYTLESSSSLSLRKYFIHEPTKPYCQIEEVSQKMIITSTLDFIPTSTKVDSNVNSIEFWSPEITPITSGYHVWNLSSETKTIQDINSRLSVNENIKSVVIPTKNCSCLGSEIAPTVVYSTAHINHQDCVRICPSTRTTNISDSGHCVTNPITLDIVLSPLFIDVSSNEYSELFQASSEGCLPASKDKDKFSGDDTDTKEIMEWLKEDQQFDNNNNTVNEGNKNRDSTFTEAINQIRMVDLESFIDLDEFLDGTEETSTTFQTRTDQSNQVILAEHERKDGSCIAQFNLSFLEELPEHLWDDTERISDSHLNFHSKLSSQEIPIIESCNASNCNSPAWNTVDSSLSTPLGNTKLSFQYNSENESENFSLKSQLALLKLFSEENADSLLVNDVFVPTVRFV